MCPSRPNACEVAMARYDRSWSEQQQQYQRQLERETAKQARERAAADRVATREAEQERIAAQVHRSEFETQQLDERVQELRAILVRGLHRSPVVDLNRYRRTLSVPPLDLGQNARPAPPPKWAALAPEPPGALRKAFGATAGYERRLAEARRGFAAAQEEYGEIEARRQAFVKDAERRHAAAVAAEQLAVDRANQTLAVWLTGLEARSREDVERYLAEVLIALPLPHGLPRRFEVTFSHEDEHVVVQLELPGPQVIPEASRVAYVKARDEMVRKERPRQERADMYRAVVSQLALLAIRNLFQADPALRQVSLNGHVSSTNPATGRSEYPCLISVVVERTEFEQLVLDRVSADECLRHLKALVSAHPYAVEAVRPLVDFDRTKYAFIEGLDIVAGLDHRDDLMALTPTEFEHLVRQLFEATPGMQGWTTQPSKDDGVDAVIFNNTPITGGLTIVQAKQYSHSIGVHHVRELAGTMEDKKAGRGILVTTSRFTKDAVLLHERLGRIQLIDGAGLIYLLKETLGKEVVIGKRVNR